MLNNSMQLTYSKGCSFIGETKDHRKVVLYRWINSAMLYSHIHYNTLHKNSLPINETITSEIILDAVEVMVDIDYSWL